MNDSRQNDYGQEYYQSSCGKAYERGNGWEEIFGKYADRILKEIKPHKTLDVGCAKGFFVEALRDRGVEAYGIDISEYAVSQVREDIRPFCMVQSALLPVKEKYDLITCIEVLEHIDNQDIPLAIRHMCEASDDILFSSTPFDYEEESHVSVHTPAYWAEQFAYHGFYHDVQYDCSYICVQAMRFRRMKRDSVDLIREYENILFQKHQELTAARQRYQTSQEKVQIYKEAYQKHVDRINEELNPEIARLKEQIREAGETYQKRMDRTSEELNLKIARFKEQIREAGEKEAEACKIARIDASAAARLRLEEEIAKNRHLEEENYAMKKALEQIPDDGSFLKQVVRNRRHMETTLSGVVKKHFQDKREDRQLLERGAEYFKPVFDPVYYAQHNEDIQQVVGTDEEALLVHFITYGMDEGRRANEEFDVLAYAKYNPDVAEAERYQLRGCYLHYIVYGVEEGRRTR